MKQKTELYQWLIGAQGAVLDESPIAITAIDAVPAVKSKINQRMTERAAATVTGDLAGIIRDRNDFRGWGCVSCHYVNSCELYIYPRFINWILRKTNGGIQWPRL